MGTPADIQNLARKISEQALVHDPSINPAGELAKYVGAAGSGFVWARTGLQ
jgi:hypothetical protein